jgi:hypothetical protein
MSKNINRAGKWLINQLSFSISWLRNTRKWLINRLPYFLSWLRKKRALKISLYSLGTIIASLFVAILLILLFVDPNDYKEEIAAFLTENTGRTVRIQDDIGYTLYPWLGLDLGKVSVGNAPGFEEPVFANIDKAKLRVKLMPLFTQYFEIDTVRLEGIALNLTRKPDGSTNWSDLMALAGEEEQEQDSIILKKLQVKGFDMRHAQIVFDDQQTQSRYLFSDINLKTSPLVLNEPIQIELNTALSMSNHSTTLNGQMDLTTEITALMDDQNYQLKPLHFNLTLQGDSIPDGSQTLSINTEKIELDFNQQRFTLAGFIAKAMDGTLSIDIQADNAQETPKLSGNLNLANLNVQKILEIFSLSKDENVFEGELLTKVGLATRFEVDMAGIHFNDIQLQVDENQLKTPRLDVDFNQESLAVESFIIQAFGLPVEGQLDIQQLFSEPTINGKVVLPLFNLRKALKRLEQSQLLPAISLPEENVLPLKTAAFATQFQVREANDITLSNINLRVDDNQFKTAQLHVDLNQQTLTANALALQSFGVQLNGQLNITKLLSSPNVEGKIDLAPFNVRETVKRLETTQLLPAISLPEEKVLPLKTAAFATQFKVRDMNNVTLNNINLSVDDNQFKTAQLHVDLNQQTLTANALALQTFGMQLNGQLNITKLLSSPNIEGKIDLAPFNVRETVKRLEQTQLLPAISLPEEKVLPLKTAAFATQFQVRDMNDITLNNINLRVDDNQFKTPQLHVNLNQQTLTADTLALQTFGMQLNGQLNITKLLSSPNVEGKIDLAPFNVRETVKRLETTQLLPVISLPDEKVLPLKTAAFTTQFQVRDMNDITLSNMNLSVDDNQFKTPQLHVDLNQQTLTADTLGLQTFGVQLNGQLNITQLLSSPNIEGKIDLAPFNVRETVERLETTQLLPVISLPDEKVLPLKTAAFTTQFQVRDMNDITLSNMNLSVDDNQFKTPQLHVDLNQQTLTADTLGLQTFGVQLNGQLNITQLLSSPNVEGKIDLAPFNVRETLKRLEQTLVLPAIPLPQENVLPLKTADFTTQFQVRDMNDIILSNINLSVDDNQFKTAQLHVDLNQQTLTADTLALQTFGMQLNGQLNITQLLSSPNIEGKIDLAPFNVRETVKRLEQTQLLPAISLPEEHVLPLKTAAFTTQFQVRDMNNVTLNNINLSVDDNQFKTPQLHVDLNQQTLTADTLALQTFGMQLNGQLNITQLLSSPNIEGKIDLAPFNVRETMKRLEQTLVLPAIPLPQENVLPLKTAAFTTQFQVRDMNDITLSNMNLSVDDNQFKTAQLHVDLNQQTLTADTLALQTFGMQLNGQLNITKLLSSPNVEGKIDLAPFNVRETVKRLETTQLLPAISLPEENVLPLKQASFTMDFQIHETALLLNNLQLSVDDNQLKTNEVYFDVKQETLDAKAFTLKALGMNLTGNLQAQQLLSDMQLNAKLSLAPFNPQQVLKRVGQTPLELPAPLTLTRATLKTHLSATTQEITLNDLFISVDNNEFNSKQLNINFANDTLTTNQFALDFLGAALNGDLLVEQMSTQQKLKATLKLSANLRQFLTQLEQPVPKTADANVLTKLFIETQLQGNLASLMNAKSKIAPTSLFSKGGILPKNGKTEILSSPIFSTGKSPILNLNRRVEIPSQSPLEGILSGPIKTDVLTNPYFSSGKLPSLEKREFIPSTQQKPKGIEAISLNPLKIQLDESHLQGKLQVQSFQPPAITFNLEVDNLEVDRYLPPAEDSEAKDKDDQPMSLPSGEEALSTLEKLRTLQIDGHLKVDKLIFYSFKINNIDLNVAVKDGKISVTPNGTFFLPSIRFD